MAPILDVEGHVDTRSTVGVTRFGSNKVYVAPFSVSGVSLRLHEVLGKKGASAGADEYVTKPFDGLVLVARVRALLRRAAPAERQPDRAPLMFGDLTFDPVTLEARRAGQVLTLTTTELKLLREFAAAPGTVLTRDILLERVWDYAGSGDTRVVDVHIRRLRAKIGRDRVETVRGFGYKLHA